MYEVKKRDGSIQPFDENKIVSAVTNAGGTKEEADSAVAAILDWLGSLEADEPVESIAIRDKVLENLASVNPTAAETFKSYTK